MLFHELSKSTSNKFIAAIRVRIKLGMVFYNFFYGSTFLLKMWMRNE